LCWATAPTCRTPDHDRAGRDTASAAAELTSARITALGLTIELGAVSSRATARCVPTGCGLEPVYSASSTIGALRVNGVAVPIGSRPVTIPLRVGSLKLNTTTTTSSAVIQTAVELHTRLGNIVLGQARTGTQGTPVHATGNPCAIR
jgi:hypothetical protein